MGAIQVGYASSSEDTNRGRSPGLWKGSHYEEIMAGNNQEGLHWGDDFTEPMITGQRYTLLEADSNAAWASLTTVGDGRQTLTLSTSDNEEGNVIYGDGEYVIGDITANSGVETYFEARWKVSSVVDDVVAVYVGLAEAGMAGANMQTDDSGVLSAKDYLMHRTLHVDSGTAGTNAVLGVAYNTNSGTEVESVTTADTLVADTFVKTGFVHDGKTTIKSFVNGLANATTIAPTDTTFPDGEELTFAAGAKLGDTTGAIFTLDWWHVVRRKIWSNT